MFNETEFYDMIAKMYNKKPEELTKETRLKEDLGATSQTLFAVSALLERASGKKVAFAAINNCVTLGDAIALTED